MLVAVLVAAALVTAGPARAQAFGQYTGAAVYRGDEDFAGLEKSYWNIALVV